MQSEAPPAGQGSSSQHVDPDTTPPASKRRCQSPRSAQHEPDGQAESSSATSTSTAGTILKASPQHHGSSRDSEMQRSMTPPESGSIRYTRTGRVSKATKGQRIHACEECGKTYTRNEHLRRHQQNHKPGAFVCDVPGCSRSFYREDLLTRHKERHNDPFDPPTRRTSIGSQSSMHQPGSAPLPAPPQTAPLQRPASEDADASTDDLHQSVPATTAPQPAVSRTQRKGYLSIHELPVVPQIAIPANGGGSCQDYAFGVQFDPSPPYSPNGYDSPPNDYSYTSGPPYYSQPPLARAGSTSYADTSATYQAPAASRSPVSAGSSTAYLPQWGPNIGQDPDALQHFTSSSSSETAFGSNGAEVYGNCFGEHLMPCWTNGVLRMMPPEERDIMELDELLIPSVTPPSSSGDLTLDGASFTNEQRYLGSYWMWVHPLFSVVHKPSFNLQAASPLLRAAMLALGAHMLQNPTDMGNARIIHERAQKVLMKRTANTWHTYRVCDMQAVLLHEVFAVFRSRRPPLQFSRTFEDVYRNLAHDTEAANQEASNALYDSPLQTRSFLDDLHNEVIVPRLEAKCKQRLLLACYTLDQQHAMLFGRQRTDCLTDTMGELTGLTLPFGRSQQYWDASPEMHPEIYTQKMAAGVPACDQVYQALSMVPDLVQPLEIPFDAFRSVLMMTCLTDPNHDLQTCGFPMDNTADPDMILLAVEQSPRMRLAYHTFMLCHHTPIRDLLAVAGESWVMAEKLGSQNQYIASQLIARDWATVPEHHLGNGDGTQRSPVQRAVSHAQRILEINMKHPKTGLLFQEWSLYLASVVIWARAHIANTESRRRPWLAIPNATEPRLAPHEVERSVVATVAAGPEASLSWNEAQNVLLWTKSKIEKVDVPHNCGLTNSALDVLGKLIARGNEEGWFA